MLKEKHRHENAAIRQRERAEHERSELEYRKTKLTFIPTLAAGFGVACLLGTALIILILVGFGAKDQIALVLAFVSGLVGGILAGFGGGYATAKALPSDGKTPKTKPKAR